MKKQCKHLNIHKRGYSFGKAALEIISEFSEIRQGFTTIPIAWNSPEKKKKHYKK